jgi:hypothetical protein
MSELLTRAVYWGQSANRCFRPTGKIDGATAGARTEDVVFPVNGGYPRVGWARWYVSAQNELTPAGDGTLIVRMEYPAGVYTYATENINAGLPGAPAAVPHLNNSTLYLNFNKFVPAWSIPMTAPRFRVIQQGDGIVFRQGPGPDQAAPACYLQTFTGTPPAMTDAFPGQPGEYSYPPVAYLVQTRRPSALLIGDSREEGPYSEGGRPPFYHNGLVGPALMSAGVGYINMSESGTGIAGFLAAPNKARRLELAGNVSHVGDLLGYNDMNAFSRSEAQVVTDHTAFAALFPDKTVFGCTLMNTNSTTDGFTTKANQSLSANALKTRRHNNLMRAGVSGQAFYLDVDDAVNPERTGKFPVGPNPFDAARASGCTFTGSISGSVLTVSAISSGSLNYGDPLTDSQGNAGTPQLSGCTVLDQITGTAGSTGTYTISRPQTLASKTLYVGGWATVEAVHQTKMLAEQVQQKLTPAVPALIR